MQVQIHDFRVTDRVLAETDPEAGDVVFLGRHGSTAAPFVVMRRLSGPGGTYIDASEIVDGDGRSLGVWERRFEIDGESKPRTIVTEMRDVPFPEPGTYTLRYSVYDDVIATFPFTVAQEDGPGAGIVPGPVDAALSKSTILWLSFADELPSPDEYGGPVDDPRYLQRREWPVWYGYENGRIYVLVGEGEQKIPGLTDARHVRVVARSKAQQSGIPPIDCSVQVLKKDAEWDRVARELLVGRRLNLRDGDAAPNRWKQSGEIAVLVPLPPPVPVDAEQPA